MPSIKIKNI